MIIIQEKNEIRSALHLGAKTGAKAVAPCAARGEKQVFQSERPNEETGEPTEPPPLSQALVDSGWRMKQSKSTMTWYYKCKDPSNSSSHKQYKRPLEAVAPEFKETVEVDCAFLHNKIVDLTKIRVDDPLFAYLAEGLPGWEVERPRMYYEGNGHRDYDLNVYYTIPEDVYDELELGESGGKWIKSRRIRGRHSRTMDTLQACMKKTFENSPDSYPVRFIYKPAAKDPYVIYGKDREGRGGPHAPTYYYPLEDKTAMAAADPEPSNRTLGSIETSDTVRHINIVRLDGYDAGITDNYGSVEVQTPEYWNQPEFEAHFPEFPHKCGTLKQFPRNDGRVDSDSQTDRTCIAIPDYLKGAREWEQHLKSQALAGEIPILGRYLPPIGVYWRKNGDGTFKLLRDDKTVQPGDRVFALAGHPAGTDTDRANTLSFPRDLDCSKQPFTLGDLIPLECYNCYGRFLFLDPLVVNYYFSHVDAWATRSLYALPTHAKLSIRESCALEGTLICACCKKRPSTKLYCGDTGALLRRADPGDMQLDGKTHGTTNDPDNYDFHFKHDRGGSSNDLKRVQLEIEYELAQWLCVECHEKKSVAERKWDIRSLECGSRKPGFPACRAPIIRSSSPRPGSRASSPRPPRPDTSVPGKRTTGDARIIVGARVSTPSEGDGEVVSISANQRIKVELDVGVETRKGLQKEKFYYRKDLQLIFAAAAPAMQPGGAGVVTETAPAPAPADALNDDDMEEDLQRALALSMQPAPAPAPADDENAAPVSDSGFVVIDPEEEEAAPNDEDEVSAHSDDEDDEEDESMPEQHDSDGWD